MPAPDGWNDWLGVVGSVASVLSLFPAGYAAWRVRSIYRKLVFNVQSARLVSEVEDTVRAMAERWDDKEQDEREIEIRFRTCLARVNRHHSVMSSDIRVRLRNLQKLERAFTKLNSQGSALKKPDDAEQRKSGRKRIVSDMIVEFRILAPLLRDMIEARQIGGADDV